MTDVQTETENATPDLSDQANENTIPTDDLEQSDGTQQGEDAQSEDTQQGEGEGADGPTRSKREQALDNEGEIAADYLEELLDIADLDGDIDTYSEGGR